MLLLDLFNKVIRILTGMNVPRDARAQPASDRGISRDSRTRAYFLVPELTIPQRNWKMEGSALAKIFDTHRLSHTVSTHVKIHTILTPLAGNLAFGATVAPMMIGTAIKIARGRT